MRRRIYSGIDNIANYTGYTWDEVGEIYFAKNRFYNPNNRTFITEDPIKDGTNWYAYCENNPVNYIDWYGLFAYEMRNGVLVNLDEEAFGKGSVYYKALQELNDTRYTIERYNRADWHYGDIEELENIVRKTGDLYIKNNPITGVGIGVMNKIFDDQNKNPKFSYTEHVLFLKYETAIANYSISAQTAVSAEYRIYGSKWAIGNEADAFRHMYWSSLMADYQGDKNTRILTNAHEYAYSSNFVGETSYQLTIMDFANNEIGRKLVKDKKNEHQIRMKNGEDRYKIVEGYVLDAIKSKNYKLL